MMAKKHLHELLKEDQEPFHINHYIANKRFQLKRLNFSSPKTSLQLKKQHPFTQTSTSTSISKSTFCKHANCFFSFHEYSPDVKKFPLSLPSPAPAKSPQNGITATLLLEAAMRIQKQQSSKPNTQIKKIKFGYFKSILKRLKDRNSDRKSELKNGENSNNSNVSCSFWSESNEEKFMDLENCSSGDFGTFDRRYPLSPFRFSLQRCPSSGYVKPDFSSPAASPINHKKEDKIYETIALARIELEEDDEKEQCSPISVLDPPFEEDDHDHDGHECRDDDEDDDEDSDLECSYALVQRTQQQLLYKLRRFEKLAELDPIELEKLMLDADDNDDLVEEEDYQDSDLISEEKTEVKSLNYGEAVEYKRFDLWQELTSNTIDMMVELALKSEFDEWNKFQKQREETAIEFTFSIFALLVEELGEELLHLAEFHRNYNTNVLD